MSRGGKRPGAGRPKGAPNKRSDDIKERLESLGASLGKCLAPKFNAICD